MFGGSKLLLNGSGTRYKGPFKDYVAGLYLGKKASTLDDVVNQPGPKRISITMVRDIDATELGKLLTRGIQDNMAPGEMSKLVPDLMRMGQMFSEYKNLVTGDNFMITHQSVIKRTNLGTMLFDLYPTWHETRRTQIGPQHAGRNAGSGGATHERRRAS